MTPRPIRRIPDAVQSSKHTLCAVRRPPHTECARYFGRSHAALVLMGSLLFGAGSQSIPGDDSTQTGPETEKRFPPLKVPTGFKATLFACDPLIEYPSAIAHGPKPGSIFVAVDYMTGLGTEIVRRDEIRLIEDTDGDGYADKATVYAGGFNSIEGMTFHDGVVYAMHAPLLTALRDTDGDGVADERRDLLTGLGLTPEENPVRLHCANGITWGYDGWLYLALGDHGCDVPRPEGDRLVFNGGGILRCRTDGRDLHVFAMGLRNIYDVALDDELNVFVRDNENDGGDYKIRVCHSFFGSDHGYPYLYSERPDEALPPLADLGLGSSAGGVAYLEHQFPPEFRGNLFFCEWGRAVMRYAPKPSGSSFAPLNELEFAAGADNDPYGFKPTDLVVERDGSLLIADWCDGQRPKRGRGRIYRITRKSDGNSSPRAERPDRLPKPSSRVPASIESESNERLVARLDSASYAERIAAQAEIERRGRTAWTAVSSDLTLKTGGWGRMHAVWIESRIALGKVGVSGRLLEIARDDFDVRVRMQAVRALADLNDPVLSNHRLSAGTVDEKLAQQIASIMTEIAPDLHGRPVPRTSREQLEIVVAIGRLRWKNAPNWLADTLRKPDPALAHAAMQTMRHAGNWPAVLRLLDRPDGDSIRAIAMRAIADQAVPDIVEDLIERLRVEPIASHRREYADLLTRVYRNPGPWTYWGYRPPPRPANTVDWERTPQIKHAVNAMLLDPDRAVRLAVLRRMQREKILTIPDTIEAWLADERDAERVAAILESLKEHRAELVREMLVRIVREEDHAAANRLSALAQVASGLDEATEACLIDLAGELEDGPVLAALLEQTGKRTKLGVGPLLVRKLNSTSAEVRAAAVQALAELRFDRAGEAVRPLLDDRDAQVRRAAATAVGKLKVSAATDPLLKLAADPDASVRAASLNSLRILGEPRALASAVAALDNSETQLVALACVGDFGSPEHTRLVAEVAKRSPSAGILREAVSIFTRWDSKDDLSAETRSELARAVAEIQGSSGVVARWSTLRSLSVESAEKIAERSGHPGQPRDPDDDSAGWKTELASSSDSNFSLRVRDSGNPSPDGHWLCLSDVWSAEATSVQFLASSNGSMRVWLNGRSIYERPQAAAFQPDSDRFIGTLATGPNRLIVQVSAAQSPTVHLRFRRISSRAEHEQLVQAALARPGNAERGRKLFFDAEKSQCIKCHRLGDQGERIGPELTSVGNRFSRVHIIESILEPSRTLAPSYESLTIALKDGRILSGLRVAETDTTLTLADNQAVKHSIEKSAIEEHRVQPTSIMPDGLEKRLTTDEFVDLIAFLVSQKGSP